jgi:branched-chain amino acid transport system substrate-binding protein
LRSPITLAVVSRLRIAAPFFARSHGNPETKGHEQSQNASVAYVPQLPMRARSNGRRQLRDATLAALVLSLPIARVALAQISDDAVKIGVLTDMSSLYSDGTGKGSLVAAQMAAEDFGGKVRGKPIEVIGGDHLNKPDVGSNIARNWYDNEKVDAIADVPTSSIALAVQGITKEKSKVLLLSGAGTSDLTGKACSPNGIQWTYDTYAQSNVSAREMVKRGGDTWFFISADYAFGEALQRDAANIVIKSGGKVLGNVRHPLNTNDFSSFLLQAQASGAKVIALANAGSDASNAIKQAHEFGLTGPGSNQQMLALLLGLTDSKALGLQLGQGLIVTEGFYWDLNNETRAFSKRFNERVGHMPTMFQAGVYSSVAHYLKAAEAAGTDDAKTVIAKMRELPVNDFFAKNGVVREDGRMVHDMYLLQMKTPAESKGEWDLYNVLSEVPGPQAFRPLSESECPLVKK